MKERKMSRSNRIKTPTIKDNSVIKETLKTIDLGTRGIYSKNNKLNDLTGREWKFATKSVINKVYPLNLQHKLRKQHGGQKPPELCTELVKIFTKEKAVVLDPLAGVGGTLLGAALCNRKAMGIEINPKWLEIYKQVCKLENIKEQKTIAGDCKVELEKFSDNSFDFVLTDVPYWHMDRLEKTRSKRIKSSNLSHFNGSTVQTKNEWLAEMKTIFHKCQRVLKDRKYLAIFIGDMYRENEYHILSAELANTIKNPNLILKANLIWYDVSKSLHVYGYPSAFIPSMIHQNILIFRKET
ncbi:DNA methyltransferase [Candidatus Oleimmundimicrobium sp.]|uniref:TRM11 family SAM-dependent methyltransferase n=1 Tax=Candidatus Oleimmundimicrobium sp. TaxID=3060597 RepID=UPI002726A0CE|nr:DNA methyltransferase [Candidatus Oleimmundimicrobium sp.]MDO8886804.1 DNA methyltransferase [Candidatus Oleimmundimicrobium sp.]